MNKAIFWICMLGLSLSGQTSAAELGEQIANQGNDKGAIACSTCHGNNGEGSPAAGAPRLAGLNADYLAKQLRDFQADSRTNPVMQGMAKALSQEEVTAVAGYFAGLAPTANTSSQDEALVSEGQKIADRGLWNKDIPACSRCHGKQGLGVGSPFPALAGQDAGYIEAQIQAWKNGNRANDPNALMKSVAERLSDAETKAVAAYFAQLPPVAAQ